MALPCLKNARRIFAIVSTTSIPTSASKNHGSQCGPSVPGSRLEADHPEKGVLFACRFTVIQAFASPMGVELTPITLPAGEWEQELGAFARGPTNGLIVVVSVVAAVQRARIV